MDPLDDESAREAAVGEALKRARGRESQRAVAARAGVSPTQWRHMENGIRDNGVPVRASDRTLEAAARAVGLDPAALFEIAGRPYESSDEPIHLSASGADLDQLRVLDPDAYELVMAQAKLALDRAHRRRESGG